jgi:hypothetical protein
MIVMMMMMMIYLFVYLLSMFMAVYHCVVFKKYTGLSKFPFRELPTPITLCDNLITGMVVFGHGDVITVLGLLMETISTDIAIRLRSRPTD